MTKRKRISKKAQRRRRRTWELMTLWGVERDTFYGNGYWYITGVDVASPDDQIAVVVFIRTPENDLILHDMVRQTIQRAVYRIQAMDYLKLSEKCKAMSDFTLSVLQNANAGQSAWARFMQQAVANAITDEGETL